MRINILFLLLVISINFQAQTDSLNQYNSKGKKQGFWKCYLDDKLYPSDSVKARYFGYEFYDEGKSLTRFTIHQEKRGTVIHNGAAAIPGTPEILSGEYYYYDKDLRVKCINTYKNGYPLTLKVYLLQKNKEETACLNRYVDYSKTHKGLIGSYYWEVKGCLNPEVDKYWFTKKNGVWQSLRLDELDSSNVITGPAKKTRYPYPKSIIELGGGIGTSYGGVGGNMLLGYKGTGLLLALGVYAGELAPGAFIQFGQEWFFFSLGRGVVGVNMDQKYNTSSNIYGNIVMVGFKINLEHYKRLYLSLSGGYQDSSVSVGYNIINTSGPVIAAGLGFRISFSKSDYERYKK